MLSPISLPLHTGYPWLNIAYWAYHCRKAVGLEHDRFIDHLRLHLGDDEPGLVLKLINSCLADQLRDEGVADITAPGLKEMWDDLGDDAQDWIETHPQKPGEEYGMLECLPFYYR